MKGNERKLKGIGMEIKGNEKEIKRKGKGKEKGKGKLKADFLLRNLAKEFSRGLKGN